MAQIIRTKAQKQLAVLDAIDLFQQLPELEEIPPETPVPDPPAAVAPIVIDELVHTPGHGPNCPACKALNAALQAPRRNIASLTFSQARVYWAALRLQDSGLRPSTHECDANRMLALERFFGPIELRDITPGHLRAYQIAREKNSLYTADGEVHPWKRRAVNSTINHELSLLGRMLHHCRLWKNLKEYYFPRPIPEWSPREIMEEKEEAEFFRRGVKDPQARLAYLVACLTNNTTASGSELRFLRLRHLFLRPPREISEIYVPPEGVKNDSRPRKISLNRTARYAVQQLYARALELGCSDPEHFLFPFWVKRNQYDPTRPASKTFLRKSWARLRKITGHPELRPHDLRHHCITRMLERGEDPETVRAIAGHLSRQMTEYYSHQRKRVKYDAVRKIDPAARRPPQRERRGANRASPRTRSPQSSMRWR